MPLGLVDCMPLGLGGVCLLRGVCLWVWGCTPPGRHTPADTPRQTPLDRHSLDRHSPQADTPLGRHPLGRQPSEAATEADRTHLTDNSVEYELFAFRQW